MYLNFFFLSIQLTCELEKNCDLPFLDMLISRSEDCSMKTRNQLAQTNIPY